jgi:hypothetical protein
MRAYFHNAKLRVIFKRGAKLTQGTAAHPHPPIADAIATFSRAKSAGEGFALWPKTAP